MDSKAPRQRRARPLLSSATHAERIRQLFALAPAAAIAIVVGTGLIVLWLYDTAATPWFWGWVSAMLTLAALRASFALWARAGIPAESVLHRETVYVIISGATGLAWGMLAWVPLPAPDPEHQRLFIIALSLFLVLFVSGNTLMASPRSFAAMTICLIVPLAIRLAALENRVGPLLSLGAFLICGMVLAAHRLHYHALVNALEGEKRSHALLQQQRVIFTSVGEGIVFLKPGPEYATECSRHFAEIFGYSVDEVIGMEPWHWHPDRDQWKALVINSSPTIAAGKPYRQEIELKRANGELFWAEVTGMAIDPENLQAGTVWVVSDITERRAAKRALRLSEQRFRDLVKLSSDVYWEQEENFRFTKFDGPDAVLKRLPLYHFLGRTRWGGNLISGVPRAQWEAHIATLERHEPFRDFVYQLELGDDQTCWMSVSGNPLFDDNGRFTGYHGTSSDVTTRILTEKRYRHLAYHDPLTQLPNRRLLEDRLEQAIRSAQRKEQRLALLVIDLDGFKLVNDRFGHAAGDKVLEVLAARLSTTLRDVDTIARYGGDEFIVLLPDIKDVQDALSVAEKLHEIIGEPIPHDPAPLSVGSSIGMTLYPDHGDNTEHLLAHADAAMYRAKHEGGHRTEIYDNCD